MMESPMKSSTARGAAMISLALLALGILLGRAPAQPPSSSRPLKTRNVVLIVLDGLRWQEIFDGADGSLLNARHGHVQNVEAMSKAFWRDTPAERRKALFPFLWGVVAQQGQIYGNQHKNSVAHVTNGFKFSYPGYNEMLTGYPDHKINSNEFGPNPNKTVFEWLDQIPDFHDQLAVFATWSAFNDIFNLKRSGLFTRAGWDLAWPEPLTPRQALLKKLYTTTSRIEDDDVLDSFLHENLLDYLESHHPRALFVGYGETDDWAHEGRYDLVLQAAHEDDQHIAELWAMMQANPAYHDQVTFIITADHGRGGGLKRWKDHGKFIAGAENIWIAVLGPDTPPLGEIADAAPVTQSQIASTIAALLGQDYNAAVPKAAAPLPILRAPDPLP
jgi:hypothetical protein